MEAIYYSAHSTLIALFFNVVFNVLVFMGLNIPLRKIAPKLVFRQGELITLYIMLSQSAGLVGHSMLQILPPSMAAPFGLATPENEWSELFGRYIPKWLAITDQWTLDGYITGVKTESSLYTARHIEAWLSPVLVWSGFICVLMFVMICINIIIRKQWADRERLTFPIVQLPFHMTNPASKLFSNRLFLISFGVVSLISLVNGLHFFFPTVPYLRVKPYDLGTLFTTKPWNALGTTMLTFRPFILGLIFLIPLDIAFSCWFFFFFWKAQIILGSVLGFRQRPEFPEQSTGAYIALFIIALWIGKGHLVRIVKSMFHLAKREERDDGATEPLSYRNAMLGLVLGFSFLVLFCWKAGMTMWAAGIFFALYLMTEIGVTRIRAEVGSPIHDLHFAGPEYIMVDTVGTRKMGAANLTVLSFFWFLTRAHYSDVMPHQLEGFKLADQARMNNRRVLLAMLIATVLGTCGRILGSLGFGVSAQRRHHDMGWSGTVQTSSRMVVLSHLDRHGGSGILCVRIVVRHLPYGYAMAIPVVALPSGRLRCLEYLPDARFVVHVPFGVAHQVAGLKARRVAPTSTSVTSILRHGSRRIRGGRILGAFRDCIQNRDIRFHSVVVLSGSMCQLRQRRMR